MGTGALPGAAGGTTSPSPDAARDPKKAVGVETTPPPELPADGAGASAAANTTADPDGGGTSRNPATAIVGGVLGSVVLALSVAVVFLVCRHTGDADHVAEFSLPVAGAVLGQGPVVQPYGGVQAGRIGGGDGRLRGGGAGGGAPEPNYVNPVYAHHHSNPAVDGPAYAEVADESSEEEEAPYEAPSQEQVAVYDDGGALGAARQCIETTSTGRCTKTAAAGGERCSMHVCSKTGCASSKSSKVKFCSAHAQYVGRGAGGGGNEGGDESSNA